MRTLGDYENLFDQFVPEDYDYDHEEITDKARVDGLLALIESMPNHDRLPTAFSLDVLQVRGWDVEGEVYIDCHLDIHSHTISFAYIGDFEPDMIAE
jgi:hypothetical protein